jgi:uncharacterized membrane protein required for colicin V production
MVVDELKAVLFQALLVAVIGGVVAYVLGMVIGPINAMTYGAILGVGLLLVLLVLMAKYTDVEKLDLFSFVILLVAVTFIGSVVVTALPAAAPFILSLSGALTIPTLAWTLVYIGLAMLIWKSATKG